MANNSGKNILQEDIRVLVKNWLANMRNGEAHLSPDQDAAITSKILESLSYQPKIGLFGKTGAGKSSLCNAIFGSDTAKVDDVNGCTREPQEILVELGKNRSITLVDVPGIGESIERDVEYKELYKKLIPNLDLVVWVVKADDRAMKADEEIFVRDILPMLGTKPFVVVINQADKINPNWEWSWTGPTAGPGPGQNANLQEKRNQLERLFKLPSEKIVPVSAPGKYNLIALIEQMLTSLPDDQKVAFFREIKEEFKTEKIKEDVLGGLERTVKKIASIYETIKPYIPEIVALATAIFKMFKKK